MFAEASDTVDRLFAGYRRWAITATCCFFLFAAVLTSVIIVQRMHFVMLVVLLLCGFLWIGITSISRHAFIMLKRHIKVEVSPVEFLSTQLVFIHFPFMYRKIKKEVQQYREEILILKNDSPLG